MIHALRLGDASLVVPFRYTGIIWAIALGWLIWGHLPDGWALLGSAVIAASGMMAIEGRLPRLGRTRAGIAPGLAWIAISGALAWLQRPAEPWDMVAFAVLGIGGAIAILAAARPR
jgi:drug/metabolite transporter (DMT)-like permease